MLGFSILQAIALPSLVVKPAAAKLPVSVLDHGGVIAPANLPQNVRIYFSFFKNIDILRPPPVLVREFNHLVVFHLFIYDGLKFESNVLGVDAAVLNLQKIYVLAGMV